MHGRLRGSAVPALLVTCYCLARAPAEIVDEEAVLLSFAGQLSNFQARPCSLKHNPDASCLCILTERLARPTQAVVRDNQLQGWGRGNASACGPQQYISEPAKQCNSANSLYRPATHNPWTGVSCNDEDEVVCLALPACGIAGAFDAIASLTELKSLAYLDLDQNALIGTLPPGLGANLSALQVLSAGQNSLSGSLPPEWGDKDSWHQLSVLHLQSNALGGTLPEAWGTPGAWPALQDINVSENQLQGSIPEDWTVTATEWPALQTLWLLPGNDLCGPVPSGLPAVEATGDYMTGPQYSVLMTLPQACPDSDSTSYVAETFGVSQPVADGILAAEAVGGAALLVVAAFIQRRYRWRSEREWILFDWELINEARRRPKRRTIKFWKRLQAQGLGAQQNHVDASNGKQPQSSSGRSAAPNGKEEGREGITRLLYRKSWAESLIHSDAVSICMRPNGAPWQIGSGATGKVYKGKLSGHTDCAIKVFEGAVSDQDSEALQRELAILRSSRDRHIVAFYGLAFVGDDVWMVMELLECGNLHRNLARGHNCQWYFGGRQIALDVARGMAFLHRNRIIHLDIKSPNILLASDGTAKLADVGLSRIMNSRSFVSQLAGVGTMLWMAPELLLNEQCTEKADVYSFGIILWEICTAEAPIRGRLIPVKVPDDCPQAVADLIAACMHEDPSQRPSAEAIIAIIEAVPVTEAPPPPVPWYAR